MQTIPLTAVASQTLTVILNQQTCLINVYEKTTGLFCDLYVNDVLIIAGVICQNLNRIVRDTYLGFIGDLVFFDTTLAGTDPVSTGLGAQYALLYVTPADLATFLV